MAFDRDAVPNPVFGEKCAEGHADHRGANDQYWGLDDRHAEHVGDSFVACHSHKISSEVLLALVEPPGRMLCCM
jgi:hypothetical protein